MCERRLGGDKLGSWRCRSATLQLLDIDPRRGQRRVGLRQRDAVGLGIDGEQHVAGLDHLVVVHGDR